MVEPVEAAQLYGKHARSWERRDLVAAASQVSMVVLAGGVDSLSWKGSATVSALLFLAAAVAWVYRLIATPDTLAQLLRAQAALVEGMSMRYAARSTASRAFENDDQFQSIAARSVAAISELYGITEAPVVAQYSSFAPTGAMHQTRSSPLAKRMTDYKLRVESARARLSLAAQSARRRSKKWTAIGVAAEVAGIGFAIWQAAGGPSGFVGIASLLAAGALAWNESREGADKRVALWRASRTLDAIGPRFSEVHSDVSWGVLVDEAEAALEALHVGIAVGAASRPLAL